MNYIKNKWTAAIFMSCILLIGCERYDADETVLSVTASNSTVKVGETVDFTVSNNGESLVVYTGDEGHVYSLSADYLLAELSEEELKDSIYRTPDPLIRNFSLDFSSMTSIPEDISYSTDTELVDDELNPGNKVLKVELFPTDWGKILTIHPRVGVGNENQDFTISLRFDSNDLYKKDGGTWVTGSSKTSFRIITEVIGKTSDGEIATKFSQSGLWYANTITPSAQYFDHTINLTKWINGWESANGLELETIESINLKFVGDNNAAYQGFIYISAMSLGIDGYYAFDTGVNIPITDGSGLSTYSYSFSEAGTYDVTFIGASNSFKNYEGDGYQSGRNGVSGSEYKYDTQNYTIPIVVEE